MYLQIHWAEFMIISMFVKLLTQSIYGKSLISAEFLCSRNEAMMDIMFICC